MLPAFLSTICFSISVICANRSARLIGGTEANFWRLTGAAFFLSFWAWIFGQGLSGASFPLFFLSGVIGIGVGDLGLFQALPRLGSRLSLLLIQCLTAPFAAAIEWLWLGTKLSPAEMICAATILTGIGISVAPGGHLQVNRRQVTAGVLFSILGALGGAIGAVMSRKAYAIAEAHHQTIDGATAAYQRVFGGLMISGVFLLVVKWRSIRGHLLSEEVAVPLPAGEKWRKVWPWVLVNSLAGQTIGVSFYQWALKTEATGIVLPICATAPIVAIPFTMWMEGERPNLRSITGGLIAVGGVIGLTLLKPAGH